MKKYTMEIAENKKGLLFTTTNKGFTSIELAGILSLKLLDIHRQWSGEITPKVKYARTTVLKKKKAKKPIRSHKK